MLCNVWVCACVRKGRMQTRNVVWQECSNVFCFVCLKCGCCFWQRTARVHVHVSCMHAFPVGGGGLLCGEAFHCFCCSCCFIFCFFFERERGGLLKTPNSRVQRLSPCWTTRLKCCAVQTSCFLLKMVALSLIQCLVNKYY